jgi:hypothetical protein
MKSFVNLHSQIFDQVVVHLSSLPEIDYKQNREQQNTETAMRM